MALSRNTTQRSSNDETPASHELVLAALPVLLTVPCAAVVFVAHANLINPADGAIYHTGAGYTVVVTANSDDHHVFINSANPNQSFNVQWQRSIEHLGSNSFAAEAGGPGLVTCNASGYWEYPPLGSETYERQQNAGACSLYGQGIRPY